MAWQPELSDHEDVQRRFERSRDFVGNWDAAARQSQHDQVASAGQVFQLMREGGPGVPPIGEP
jgi:hypothetical protein